MKVTSTPAPESTVVLEVELPADRLQRSIDDAVRHLARRTRVPGFRPGKAPRVMLERALGVRRSEAGGPDPVYEDAKEHLFEGSVLEAIQDQKLDPMSIPAPDWLEFTEGTGARYRVALPVRPEVKLGAYAGYPFGISIEEIDDAKVEQVVEQLRDQAASLVPVEDREARKTDYAVIGFEGRRDGVPFEGGTAERLPLVIGAERMIPGFEDELVGMREDEEKTFPIRFPDDYPDEALAGQEAEFTVRLRELREKRLPPLDDEFARSTGAYADLDELRKVIKRRLAANARDRARHEFSDRIIEFAVANATVDVPRLLVDREVEVMLDELRVRLAEQGIAEADYLRVTEKDIATLEREYREPAMKRVKTLLVLSAVADAEGIEVGPEAVAAEIGRARERYTENPKLIEYFSSPRGRAYLESTLRRTKVVETLVDRWLSTHPEVGPVPHLEDAEAVGPDGARSVDPSASRAEAEPPLEVARS